MLIRFIPAAPHQSTIIFSLSFLDNGRQCPLTLALQLQRVIEDNLELPHDWHALDKAVGVISLIDEITFCGKELHVSCRFKDGCIEEWPMNPSCSEMLELVLADVNDATLAEQEVKQPSSNTSPSKDSPPLSLNSFKNKHKKQRSLLKSFVSSIVPYHTPRALEAVSAPETTPAPSSVIQVSPRFLRRRARSNLVNAFRIYALPELKMRMPRAGYYPWILQSMLRRTSIKLQGLVGGTVPYSLHPGDWSRRTSLSTPSLTQDSGDFSDDETDSLRTPSIQHPTSSIIYFRNDSQDSVSEFKSAGIPALAEYTNLFDLASHLEELLHQHHRQEEAQQEAEREANLVLAVRSRRRAWLNKALTGAAWEWGLAAPFESSPLAQYSRTPDECSVTSLGLETSTDSSIYFKVSPSPSKIQPGMHVPTVEHFDSWEFEFPSSGNILNRTLRQSLSSQSAQDLQDPTWTFRPSIVGCP